jgi:hypothetical protein
LLDLTYVWLLCKVSNADTKVNSPECLACLQVLKREIARFNDSRENANQYYSNTEYLT